MDKYNIKETQGIFFQGQIFDAYTKFESFMSAAKKEIILIDNYVDLSILQRLAKKRNGVNVLIYTDPKTKLTTQDVQTFNTQYPTLTLNFTTKTHDRFLIIDNTIIKRAKLEPTYTNDHKGFPSNVHSKKNSDGLI